MTEVLDSVTPIVEAAYFDNIGNTLSETASFGYEVQDTQRYLDDIKDEKEYIKLPRSVLGLIAAYGQPGLTDSYIRYTTWYVHRDKTVLHQTMARYEQVGLVDETIATAEMNLNTLERPDERYYSLTTKAYEMFPNFGLIAEKRQPTVWADRMAKIVLSYLGSKHKLDDTGGQS